MPPHSKMEVHGKRTISHWQQGGVWCFHYLFYTRSTTDSHGTTITLTRTHTSAAFIHRLCHTTAFPVNPSIRQIIHCTEFQSYSTWLTSCIFHHLSTVSTNHKQDNVMGCIDQKVSKFHRNLYTSVRVYPAAR